jgi:hypothetical protein
MVYNGITTDNDGTFNVEIDSQAILKDDTETACNFFMRSFMDMKSDTYWIGWQNKEKYDQVHFIDNKVKNKVSIVLNQYYMTQEIQVCEYDRVPS